jgi:hypothetical protein
MKRVRATREQLIEWIQYDRGEISLQDVSDETLILMAGGLEVGDIVVTPNGEYPVKPKGSRQGDGLLPSVEMR